MNTKILMRRRFFLAKLHNILLIIFGIFSNLTGMRITIYGKERNTFRFKIANKFFYIMIEDGKIKTITTEKPILIEIYPHLKCNLNCLYCDRGKEDSMLEDFNEIKILHDNLKEDRSFRLRNYRISGGEPSIYPKVDKLISFLHSFDPYGQIEFFTNAIELKKVAKESLKLTKLMPSVYPYTEQMLQNDKYVVSLFESLGMPLKVNRFFNEDMDSYGSIRKANFNPFASCFHATLICGTRQVYPCCRAHRLEQKYHKKYHLYIDTQNLYKNLKDIIKGTDLCTHCPRFYNDCAKISLKIHTKQKEKNASKATE